MEAVESITVNCEVKVNAEDGVATVVVPPELRLTERLVSFLHAALAQRDLELKHWTITTPEHEKELENLPNVTMGQEGQSD
jgi:hypothetical protein